MESDDVQPKRPKIPSGLGPPIPLTDMLREGAYNLLDGEPTKPITINATGNTTPSKGPYSRNGAGESSPSSESVWFGYSPRYFDKSEPPADEYPTVRALRDKFLSASLNTDLRSHSLSRPLGPRPLPELPKSPTAGGSIHDHPKTPPTKPRCSKFTKFTESAENNDGNEDVTGDEEEEDDDPTPKASVLNAHYRLLAVQKASKEAFPISEQELPKPPT
jgi:hypothetical protein